MALSDPIAITIGSLTSFPKTGVLPSGHGSEYTDYGDPGENGKLTFSHQYGKRTRRVARVDYSWISSDILLPDVNKQWSQSLYVVADEPAIQVTGMLPTKDIYTALHGFLSASTYAQFDKWAVGES